MTLSMLLRTRGSGEQSGVAVVFLGGEHADELAAAVEKALQFEQIRGRERSDGGFGDLAEVGDDGGVEAVGFGEQAHAFGEVADLPGVDGDGGEPGGQQGGDGGFLVGPGRFADDPLGSVRRSPGDELGDALGGVGE